MKNLFTPHQKPSWAIPENLRVILDEKIEHEQIHPRKLDLNMDEKKLRRIISNRRSAYRLRRRTTEYVKHMEEKVKDLEEKISFLTSQIDSYAEKQKILLLENNSLQKLILIRSNESKISEIKLATKRLEICRLQEQLHTLRFN